MCVRSSESTLRLRRHHQNEAIRLCAVTEGSVRTHLSLLTCTADHLICNRWVCGTRQHWSGPRVLHTHSCGLAGPLPAARLQSPSPAAWCCRRRCSQSPGHSACSSSIPAPASTQSHPLQPSHRNLRFPLSVLFFSYPFTFDYITNV